MVTYAPLLLWNRVPARISEKWQLNPLSRFCETALSGCCVWVQTVRVFLHTVSTAWGRHLSPPGCTRWVSWGFLWAEVAPLSGWLGCPLAAPSKEWTKGKVFGGTIKERRRKWDETKTWMEVRMKKKAPFTPFTEAVQIFYWKTVGEVDHSPGLTDSHFH